MKQIWEIIKKNFIVWFWIALLVTVSVYVKFPTDKYPIRQTRELMAIILITVLFLIEATGHLTQYRSYKNGWLTALLGWIFVSNFIHYNNWTMQATITLVLFTYLIVTSIRHLSETSLEPILKALCWLVVFQCFYAGIQLLQYDCIFHDVFNKVAKVNRPVGTLENEGIFGAYLAFLIPICFIWRKWRWNIVGIMGIIFLIVSQSIRVETQSLSAMVAGITAVSVYIFLRCNTSVVRFRLFKKYRALYIKKVVIAGLILLVGAGITIRQIDKKYNNFIDLDKKVLTVNVKGRQLYTLDIHSCGRFDRWGESIELSRSKSWFGIGIGRYKQLMPLYMQQTGKTARYYTQAHNDHLQVLNELGIIGFIIYLGFMCNLFRKAWKTRFTVIGQAVLAGMCAFFVNGLTYFPAHVPHLAVIGVFFFVTVEVIGGNNA